MLDAPLNRYLYVWGKSWCKRDIFEQVKGYIPKPEWPVLLFKGGVDKIMVYGVKGFFIINKEDEKLIIFYVVNVVKIWR